ncbi:MAG TPA: TIGR03435 family protein [Vicinamibacterales bacterium]|nr:TIGR03435 family protein [Vicinamibacterales bacterium]
MSPSVARTPKPRIEVRPVPRRSPLRFLALPICVATIAVPFQTLAKAGFQDTARRFDVASIKENNRMPADMGAAFNESPSGITILNATFLRILSWASGFQERDITGGPAWIRSTRFDVVAKTDGVPITRSDLVEMTMELLRDRFKLRIESEYVDRPVYALVLSRKDGRLGEGLQVSSSNCENGKRSAPIVTERQSNYVVKGCGIAVVGGSGSVALLHGMRATMTQLAKTLSRDAVADLGRPVIDETGLTGEYDFTLKAAPDPLGPPASNLPQNFWFHSALNVQLGLKLEERDRGRVEILAIRDVQQPSEN